MATSSETAAQYGYTLAFFNTNSELKALLDRATKNGYSTARFVAELQNTNWFRTTSEPYRKAQALQYGDPATFNQQIAAGSARVLNMAGQMGAILDSKQASEIASSALKLGWNEDQLKRFLLGKLTYDEKNGSYAYGAAAAYQSQFRQTLADYGVKISDSTMRDYVRNAVMGQGDATSFKNYAQHLAASKYVALKDRIMSGETVRQIADPYIQSYGKLLEMDSENLSIDDPLIQRALQAKDKNGKPTTQTLYDFEDTLRKDPRWAKTNNARDAMSTTASAILKQFGLAS